MHHLFVEFADPRPALPKVNRILPTVRDRPPGEQRDPPRALANFKQICFAVPMQTGSQLRKIRRRKTTREHIEHRLE